MDEGFLTTVEVGQYFVTNDTEEFSLFTGSVACREYILPRDESLSEPKSWIRGNTKIGPVLEVTTCCLQGKYGVEIWIESMNMDTWTIVFELHLWGFLLVVVQTRDQLIQAMQKFWPTSENALESNAFAFASRIKG